MKIQLKYIETKEIDVKNLHELANAIKASSYGYFEFETCYGDNYGNHIFYFAKINVEEPPLNANEEDVPFDICRRTCIISWAPFSLLDPNRGIVASNMEDWDFERILQAATNLYEYKVVYRPQSINLIESEIDAQAIDQEIVAEIIKQRYQQNLQDQLEYERKQELEFDGLFLQSNDNKPDWLGGTETEEEFWSHTD